MNLALLWSARARGHSMASPLVPSDDSTRSSGSGSWVGYLLWRAGQPTYQALFAPFRSSKKLTVPYEDRYSTAHCYHPTESLLQYVINN
jgi:hypothetical protein